MIVSRVLVVGSTGSSHIGDSLFRAAITLGLKTEICDTRDAWRHGSIPQKILWQFGGRKPIALQQFNKAVVEKCRSFQPQVVLTTGMAPLSDTAIAKCHKLGIKCINFSTDDPFNPRMRAPWFLAALREYDMIFTPRRSNLDDLKSHGCQLVEYLRFGYDPTLFFPVLGQRSENDLFFAGAADAIRVQYIAAAVAAKLNIRLHGTSWNRFRATRGMKGAQADIPTLRHAIAACRVALCLVRHENRDGHSMRTFELPAVGACMVVEDTVEHREIFGGEGRCVAYFSNPTDMVEKTKFLLSNSSMRVRMRDAVHTLIANGHNTYRDRLETMLGAMP